MRIPRHRSDDFKKPDDGPVHLTADGFKRLQERLAGLKNALPEYIAETRRTAAYGDRSDNAEYSAAKSLLRRTHRQIFSIEDQIKRVVIIDTKPNAVGTVQLGSTVTLQINGVQKIFQIVGSHETAPGRGRISFHSPLGAALLDRQPGDQIAIETESGRQEYTIIEIN